MKKQSIPPATENESNRIQAAANPEWLRVSEACEYARMSKPTLYGFLNRGLIKNISFRERGQVKGLRLISFDSLRNFLESRATGGDNA